jgi:hypothetical protein
MIRNPVSIINNELMQSRISNRSRSASRARRVSLGAAEGRATQQTSYLVVIFLVCGWQLDFLFKNVANLFKLLCLAPIIEGAGHMDIVGGVRPMKCGNQHLAQPQDVQAAGGRNAAVGRSLKASLSSRTYHLKTKLPISSECWTCLHSVKKVGIVLVEVKDLFRGG